MVEDLTFRGSIEQPKPESKVRLGHIERRLLRALSREHRITVHNPDSASPEAYFRDWEGSIAGGLPKRTVPVLLRLEEKGYVFRREGAKRLLSVDFYLTQKARDDSRLRDADDDEQSEK